MKVELLIKKLEDTFDKLNQIISKAVPNVRYYKNISKDNKYNSISAKFYSPLLSHKSIFTVLIEQNNSLSIKVSLSIGERSLIVGISNTQVNDILELELANNKENNNKLKLLDLFILEKDNQIIENLKSATMKSPENLLRIIEESIESLQKNVLQLIPKIRYSIEKFSWTDFDQLFASFFITSSRMVELEIQIKIFPDKIIINTVLMLEAKISSEDSFEIKKDELDTKNTPGLNRLREFVIHCDKKIIELLKC